MAITINSNIAVLRASRQMDRVSQGIDSSFQRLGSGFRINKASDDAAGLSLIATLHTAIQIANVALRNATDGISMVSIADSAFGEITGILGRMAELAEQSANGTFSNVQRSALDMEFRALGSEIERIAVTTAFNAIPLLNGTTPLYLQVGYNSRSTSQIAYLTSSTQGTLEALNLGVSSRLTYSLLGQTVPEAQNASRTALDAVVAAIGEVSSRRGLLGAVSSRLQSAVNNLSSERENFTAAESRIRDVDVAAESAELVRLAILQKAGAAVLAQANQNPALALKLLQT